MTTLLDALPSRTGHFLLESGYHTDLWLTLDALLVSPRAVAPLVSELARRLSAHDPTAICGPFLGGAFLAHALAIELGVDFYFAEPLTQADGSGLFKAEYRLRPELQRRVRGERVAVVDDVISAGSSVRATTVALDGAGAKTVAIGTILLLGTIASEHYASIGIPLETLDRRDLALWPPSACPLCRAGERLIDPQPGEML